MALIICPECGQQVSDKAETCPHCGIKIAGNIIPTRNIEEKREINPTTNINYGNSYRPPKRNKSITLMVVSFVIALSIFGTGYYFYKQAQKTKEIEDYKFAIRSNDTLVLQTYLARYMDAPQEHRDSISMRLTVITKDNSDWENAVVSGTKKALDDYLNNNPSSPHRKDAINKIDSIDYAIASRENTYTSYFLYLQQHPDGKYAQAVQDIINTMRKTEITPADEALARNTCRRFFQAINSKNTSKLLETVPNNLENFLNRKNASNHDVITFMHKLYKDDVKNLNWHILDNFKVEKDKADNDSYNLKVTFEAEIKFDRTDSSREKNGHFIVTCIINPNAKITTMNMKKIEKKQ